MGQLINCCIVIVISVFSKMYKSASLWIQLLISLLVTHNINIHAMHISKLIKYYLVVYQLISFCLASHIDCIINQCCQGVISDTILQYTFYHHSTTITTISQENKLCSLVLKLKKWDRCTIFVSPYKNTTTRCSMVHSALFCSLRRNIPGTSFNAMHQVKAIAIGISEVNPLSKLVIPPSLFILHLSLP